LQFQERRAGRVGAKLQAQFGELLHRPQILFITEGAEQTFPERLFPAGLAGPGLQPGSFGMQADGGRFMEQLAQAGSLQLAQGRATMSQQIQGEQFGSFRSDPCREVRKPRIQNRRQGQGGAFRRFLCCPYHVKDHLLIIRIALVTMPVPVLTVQVDLHVAGAGLFAFEAQNGSTEIRAAFAIPKTGM
jgi:hypothetical protein